MSRHIIARFLGRIITLLTSEATHIIRVASVNVLEQLLLLQPRSLSSHLVLIRNSLRDVMTHPAHQLVARVCRTYCLVHRIVANMFRLESLQLKENESEIESKSEPPPEPQENMEETSKLEVQKTQFSTISESQRDFYQFLMADIRSGLQDVKRYAGAVTVDSTRNAMDENRDGLDATSDPLLSSLSTSQLGVIEVTTLHAMAEFKWYK